MSKKNRNKRKAPYSPPRTPSSRYSARRIATWLGVAAVVVALFAIAFLSTGKPSHAGNRLASGPAPAFAVRDAVSGRLMTSSYLKNRNTLLFFSEGVMCQACLEQIQSLERVSSQLAKRKLALVSITPDWPEDLRQAAASYKIHTPLLSDESRMMSRAYDVLGLGMHADMPGHTFILVDRHGVIRWRHDYTTMFVPPEKLLKEIPKLG
jgi:peroxiredoxin